jgi:hypothetical protein
LRTPFSDLPKRARQLADYGVTAVQLVGWNQGGQDRGNPMHNPDERLGTWEDLKAAISTIEALGVRVILFNKFVWADVTRKKPPIWTVCATPGIFRTMLESCSGISAREFEL